ncbi:hypothetical protein [Priestia megaterium]|uniref:hypothetical protein n=1 Tax=Priestia megaterium TaxID=1404 RepID=UPI00366DBF4E
MINIEIKHLKKLLQKALLYRLMTNLDSFLKEANIKHSRLSLATGRARTWFNDAYNNNEDIQLSSLTRVLAVINSKGNIEKYKLSDLFDQKILQITTLMMSLGDEEPEYVPAFIESEHKLFIDLISDWALLEDNKKLTFEEKEHFKKIRIMLDKEEKGKC